MCRKVQEARPRVSMEGGQSVGGEAEGVCRDLVVLVKEVRELQVRQGFPSFPNITPLGYFFGGTALAIGVFADSSCVSSAISTLMI